MIPINPEEWKEVSKDEYRESLIISRTSECIEMYDGKNWRFFVKIVTS